jgi:hypothetical protein
MGHHWLLRPTQPKVQRSLEGQFHWFLISGPPMGQFVFLLLSIKVRLDPWFSSLDQLSSSAQLKFRGASFSSEGRFWANFRPIYSTADFENFHLLNYFLLQPYQRLKTQCKRFAQLSQKFG